MQREIQNQLAPVRRRLRWRSALSLLASAMILGGWTALILALLTLFGGSFTAGMWGLVLAFGLPLVVLVFALFRTPTWKLAAQIVDRRFRLHDRVATALHLAQSQPDDPFTVLQIQDATTRLNGLDLRQAARFAPPFHRLCSGIAITLFAVALIAWGIFAPPAEQIQASGDMQDLRPEILPRLRSPTINVDAAVAQRSFDTLLGSHHHTTQSSTLPIAQTESATVPGITAVPEIATVPGVVTTYFERLAATTQQAN